MRTIALVSLLAAGCMSSAAKQYSGTVPLVFTNASPNKICHLSLAYDSSSDFGDNWLTESRGLDTGWSAEFKVKPGTYKATWSTCKDAKDVKTSKLVATYAGTRVHQTAIDIKEPTQLFAFVPGPNPPTSYAQVRSHMKLERFEGHTTVISAVADSDRER